MKKFYLSLFVASFTMFVLTAYAQAWTLTVKSSGINNPQGLISIGVYSDEEGFPDKGKEYKGAEVEVNGKTVNYTFKDIPSGTYAVATIHDVNSNGKLDTNFLGIPTEGYAFSNNLFGAFGTPPAFKDASFKLEEDKIIEIKIDY